MAHFGSQIQSFPRYLAKAAPFLIGRRHVGRTLRRWLCLKENREALLVGVSQSITFSNRFADAPP